jgi:glycine oxidase
MRAEMAETGAMEAPRVAIAGAGVIGLSLAYELAGRGARVTVLERGQPGREASWAGAGILSPASPAAREPLDRLRALSLERMARWSRELLAATGIDNGYRRSGALELASTAEEVAALREAASRWRAQGVTATEIPPVLLRNLEPALSPDIALACELPGEAQIRNPRHVRALVAACQARGVTIRCESPVTAIEARAGRVTGFTTAEGSVGGDLFVVSAGPWSAEPLQSLGVSLAIGPVRGQIVLLACPAPPFRHVLWEGERYLVPRDDGRVLVGSTEEDAGFAAVPTAAGVAGLLALAQRLVPSLAAARFERAWAGLRPAPRKDERLPFIGAVPGYPNLFVGAGHFRAGFELSAGTAVVLAELLLGETPSVPLEAFRLDRSERRQDQTNSKLGSSLM